MEKAQLALDIAVDDLSSGIIVAPFDGIIAAVDAKVGDSLSAFDYASTTIIQIVDTRSMELEADVDEIDVPDVKVGQKVIISIDALPNVLLEGEVVSVSPVADEESGVTVYKSNVNFDVPQDAGLKAGMTATADIILDERTDVLFLPDRAIMNDGSGGTVVQVLVGEEIQVKPVVTGISDGYITEIVEGLDEGEVVVIAK